MTTAAFEQAVSDLVDNEISPECFEELQAFLKSSPEARRQFRELTELHGMLGLQLVPVTFEDGLAGKKRAAERAVTSRARQAILLAGLAAAVVVLASLLAMRMLWLKEPGPTLSFGASPDTSFALTHAPEQQEGQVSPEQVMLEGSRLVVHSGVVELQYASGVRSVVRGPADLHLVEEQVLEMHRGVALFEVPANAVGFTVQTGSLEIVDLGTEFGVIAHPDGRTDEVHVFKGKVAVRPLPGTATEILPAGESRKLDGRTGMKPQDPDRFRFFDTLPEALPYLHWSFDEIVDGQFAVAGTHPHVDEVTTRAGRGGRAPETRLVDGVRGEALSFDGAGDFVQTNWPGIGGNSPRTVVMWVRFPEDIPADVDLGGVVWGTRFSGKNTKFNLSIGPPLHHQGTSTNHRVALTFGAWTAIGSTPLAGGEWHCIAATFSGKTDADGNPDVALFVDGGIEFLQVWNSRPEELPVETDIHGPHATPLQIGRTAERSGAPDHASMPYRYFRGEIDELYVFDGLLDRASIARLFREQRMDRGLPFPRHTTPDTR